MNKDEWIPMPAGVFVAAIVMIIAQATYATDWNMPRDFSGVQGENDFYYGYTFEGGPFTLMTEFGLLAQCWTVDYGLPEPWYWTYISSRSMHPDGSSGDDSRTPNDLDAVLRWSSPVADSILCEGHICADDLSPDPRSNGVDWFVKHNGLAVYSRYLEPRDSIGFTFSIPLRVEEGDAVDFVLSAHDLCEFHDRTHYTLTISTVEITGIDTQHLARKAKDVSISVAPNPFSSGTRFSINSGSFHSDIAIVIYDVQGRVIDRIPMASISPGAQSIVWKGTEQDGSRLPSGVYYVKVNQGRATLATQRLVICR